MSQEEKARFKELFETFKRSSPQKCKEQNPIQPKKAGGSELDPINTGDDAESARASAAPAVNTDNNKNPIQDKKASVSQLGSSDIGGEAERARTPAPAVTTDNTDRKNVTGADKKDAKSASATPAPAVTTDNTARKNATGADKEVEAQISCVVSVPAEARCPGKSGNGNVLSKPTGNSKKASASHAKKVSKKFEYKRGGKDAGKAVSRSGVKPTKGAGKSGNVKRTAKPTDNGVGKISSLSQPKMDSEKSNHKRGGKDAEIKALRTDVRPRKSTGKSVQRTATSKTASATKGKKDQNQNTINLVGEDDASTPSIKFASRSPGDDGKCKH